MTDFFYQPQLPLKKDKTKYRLLTSDNLSGHSFEGNNILKISSEGLKLLCEEAFKDVSHLLRASHLSQLAKIFEDKKASAND